MEETNIFSYSLQTTQEWFASIITNPLEKNHTIQPYSPNGYLIAEEASQYIVASPFLRPHQRIQIYNQQYWWRLLNTLHANFPLVTRLFGCQAFNEKIAIPYLLKYPSNHWSLAFIGERLPKWILESYQEPDQNLVYNTADLDLSFTTSFMAAQFPSLDLSQFLGDNPESLLGNPIYLQPHIRLFTWEHHLFLFRENLLKQGFDYWLENPFPELLKGNTYRFILYRNAKNFIAWREISEGEFLLLESFKNGATLSEACEKLESQSDEIYEHAVTHMQQWLQEWAHLGWLTSISNRPLA